MASLNGSRSPACGHAERQLAAKVAFLSRPESYPDRPGCVETVETHMSWVFLTDRHAYKLKKPVRYVAQDLTDLEARRRNCVEEVRVNRRLAPDVYIGCMPLTAAADDGLSLGGEGPAVEWLVQMHRLPAAGMLDRLIARGRVRPQDIRRLVAHLAKFYAAAAPRRMAPAAYRRRFAADIRANREALRRPEFEMPRLMWESPCAAQLDFLRCAPELFDRRVADGRIIDAHGDLRPEHVYLGEKVEVIDCLEFDPRFRLLDPADELSFFTMECEHLDAAFIRPLVFEEYQRITGDAPPADLLRFYTSYRACLRAKLCLWHVADPTVAQTEAWTRRARAYLELARRYACELPLPRSSSTSEPPP